MTITGQNPITYGTADDVLVTGNASPSTWQLTWVTLSYAYARAVPAGYPTVPYPGPTSASLTAEAQTIPQGTRLQLFKDEAIALVAAGAAVYS